MSKYKRHPLAVAKDKWFESEEGRRCNNFWTLKPEQDPEFYLKNRLELAFMAGAAAQEKIDQKGGSR